MKEDIVMEFYNLDDRYNDKPIIIDDRGNLLNKDKYKKINLEIKNNIKKRTLVFLFCENSIDCISIYISLLNNGIVPVMISPDLDEELCNNLINIYKPSYLILNISMKKQKFDYKKVLSNGDYIFLKTDYYEKHNLSDELALLLTTSGSTGSPKLVRQSYKNINSNASAIAKYLELNEYEKPVTTLPFNYTYGISVINSHLLVGATILVTNKSIIQRDFWDFVKKYKATSIAGVPYTYQMLKKIRFFDMDLPYLKTMTQAGGKLLVELHEEFANFALKNDKKFVVMYGQTEATARMGYLPHDKSIEKIGSMGIPIPNGRFELVDVDNNIIDTPEVIGELVYYGDNVTLGYSENIEDLSKDDERNGRLVTGDMAKFDSDGYYYIVGRKKRFLKIFGNRVNLDEVERILNSQFTENELICSGKDDNMIVYYTKLLDEKILSDFLSDTLHINKSAFKFKKIKDIPKNESGKILYSKL